MCWCVEWLGSECNDCDAEGMMEVQLALGIACSCPSLDSLASLASLSECNRQDEYDKVANKMKGRALALTSCFIRWGKYITFPDLFNMLKNQGNTSNSQCSEIEQRLGFTPAQTIRLLKQASDLGDSFAVAISSVCSFYGHFVPQSIEDHKRLLQTAANMGNSDAIVFLAFCYDVGDGFAQDKSKAIQLYRQATHLGNTGAMVNLAICYENGDGIAQDKSKAIQLYRQASDLGDADAMAKLGFCYDNGDGVAQDKSKAIQLY